MPSQQPEIYDVYDCHFCDDFTTFEKEHGREKVHLCGECFDEWSERFPGYDPVDLKKVPCPRCEGGRSWNGMIECHLCVGYGWRLAAKSPLEILAECAE